MIHQDTNLPLSERPIILITGANGSGKTQILDALLLCLGHHPNRLKKGKISDIIGSFDQESYIELTLQNPLRNGQRSIPVPDKVVLEWIDTDLFKIIVTLQQDNGINYALEANNINHNITRKQVRLIFESLNIRADNKLAFTEEGTVNIFADHSAKNKLDLLLDTTGLTAYRENLINAIEAIKKAGENVHPLKRKYLVELEYLNSMEKTRKLLKQKADLINRIQELKCEESWSHVQMTEKALQDIVGKIQKKEQERQLYTDELEEEDKNYIAIENELQIKETEKAEIVEQKEKQEKQAQLLEGKNESISQQLQKNQQKLQELERKRDSILAKKHTPEEIEAIQKKLKNLQNEKQKIENISKIVGDLFFQEQYLYDRNTLKESLHFLSLLQENNISFIGPLFWEIAQCNWENKEEWFTLLFPYTFSFLFSNKQDYLKASTIFKETYQENNPNFFIILLESSLEKNKSEYLKDFFSTLLQKKAQQTEPNYKNFPKKTTQIYYNQFLYAPWPALGKISISPLLNSCSKLSIEELQEAFHSVEKITSLRNEEEQLLEKLKVDQENITAIIERITELKQDIDNTIAEIEENKNQIDILDQNLAEIYEKYDSIEKYLISDKKELDNINKKIFHLEKQIENIDKVITILQNNKQEQENDKSLLIQEAEKLGERPEKVRPIMQITAEKSQLQGQLDTVQVAFLSEEDYNNQKRKVDQLQKEISGTEAHLSNLKTDLETRFHQWHNEVANKIHGISSTMNQLLATVAQGVKLQVDDLQQPETAGLNILVRRYNSDWHELSYLSGGEKVLTVEALILSLHLQTDSPLHAIDECTQRLDLQFKIQAFHMVRHALLTLASQAKGIFSPQFILLAPDTIGVEFTPEMEQDFQRIVLAPAKLQKN